MKLIIAGSRHFQLDYYDINGFIECFRLNPTEIVCGGCRGIDNAGKHWGTVFNRPVIQFDADWNRYNKAAGPIRNKEMAMYGDELLLIWDGVSKGSFNMLNEMKKFNKPIHEVILKSPVIKK